MMNPSSEGPVAEFLTPSFLRIFARVRVMTRSGPPTSTINVAFWRVDFQQLQAARLFRSLTARPGREVDVIVSWGGDGRARFDGLRA